MKICTTCGHFAANDAEIQHETTCERPVSVTDPLSGGVQHTINTAAGEIRVGTLGAQKAPGRVEILTWDEAKRLHSLALQTLIQNRVNALEAERQVNARIGAKATGGIGPAEYGTALTGAIYELQLLARHLGLRVEYHRPPPLTAEDALYPSNSVMEILKEAQRAER